MDTQEIASRLLAKVVEAAGGPPQPQQSPPSNRGAFKRLPAYGRTSKTGRAGSDSVGPDKFNSPKPSGPTDNVLDDADGDAGQTD